jgi:hypothetical protein
MSNSTSVDTLRQVHNLEYIFRKLVPTAYIALL